LNPSDRRMREGKDKYFFRNSVVLGRGGNYRRQLEIARCGFSFDIYSHLAKMDSFDKAKPSGRVGRKATGLLIFPVESLYSFCPVNMLETGR
jgi:hypothetical protein